MKKNRKIISICILLIFIGIFIHPEKVVYQPKLTGKVTDQNGKPIERATVARIEGKSWKNKEFGYYEYEEFKSQIVKTDLNGNFELSEKSKINWVHNIPYFLPISWCHTEFEVSKKGFKTYKSQYGDFDEYNDSLNYCKGIEFKSKIILKKTIANTVYN